MVDSVKENVSLKHEIDIYFEDMRKTSNSQKTEMLLIWEEPNFS